MQPKDLKEQKDEDLEDKGLKVKEFEEGSRNRRNRAAP